ncbi:MAG: putative endonuclease 4 [Firmicutes bacterium ADurb.Bin193]|nr:MAG: putative endonuclease 4 [Firmicutes bacterium ADurb.Bin193]
MNKTRFGTAGISDSFYVQGGKSSLEVPKWLFKLGLDAFEYQCGRGVKISEDAAKKLGENARANGVTLSVHAPYFINISSAEPEKIDKSIGYILQTAAAAHHMGAKRVVVHMGAAGGATRREAMAISKRTVVRALAEMADRQLGGVTLCMETMGKVNQMGTLDEVLEICTTDERLLPTLDFGHLNSRGFGSLKLETDFEHVIDRMIAVLGEERGRVFHSHFSKIEYTKGGERKHLTFEDTEYGPEFSPLAAVIVKRGLSPTIICESAGTQAEDALVMKRIYEETQKGGLPI